MILIGCINKDAGNHNDPHKGITHFGWENTETGKAGRCSKTTMIKFLESGDNAFVHSHNRQHAKLVVRISRFGNKYVKTISDGIETNNLLALRECKI